LLLIGNPTSGVTALNRLRDELEWEPGTVEVATDPQRLDECAAIITASAAGRPILDDIALSTGTVICDVARPPDVSPSLRARRDVCVFGGGLVSWPDPAIRIGAGNLLGLPDGVQLACLSETVLLALEDDNRDHGIGDDVALVEADYAMALAERHGFRLAPLPGVREPAALAKGERDILPNGRRDFAKVLS
jgi:predicted amino acid dehydrogenase